MSRVVATLLALIAAMFGQSLSASTALAATPDSGQVYVYDGQHHTTATRYAATERGPPTRRDTTTPTFDAVDFLSRGASAYSDRSANLSWTTYDDPSGFVRVARAAGRTTKPAQRIDANLRLLERLHVAAKSLPTLEIDASRMPNIAKNIQSALDEGHPGILSRTTDNSLIRSNRSAACEGFCGPGSPDEYPFASTLQGGAGARVAGVPIGEQRIQGGVLSSFYQKYGIGEGDFFRVIVRGPE